MPVVHHLPLFRIASLRRAAYEYQQASIMNAHPLKVGIQVMMLHLSVFVGPNVTRGQPVTAPMPPTPTPEMMAHELATGTKFVAPASDIASALFKSGPILKWGLIGVRPSIVYRFMYGDGIQVTPGRDEETTIHTI